MNPPYLLKNLPVPLQGLIRPMLLMSLALHGLLLFLPTSSEPKSQIPAEKPPKQEAVKITQLPTPAKSVAKPPTKAPPAIRQPVRPPAALVIRQRTIPPLPQKTAQPVQKTNTPPPASAPPITPSSGDQASNPTSESTAALNDPFANFPKYPNTQAGSFGLLKGEADKNSQQTPDALDDVVKFFEKELQTEGFEYEAQPDVEGEGKKIKYYQVSKGNSKPQFLHLIGTEGSGTVIFLAPQALGIGDLENLEIETQESRLFGDALTQIDDELVLVAEFNYADTAAFNSPPENVQFEEKGTAYFDAPTAKVKTFEELDSFLKTQLEASSFTVSQVGEYGGGPLYQIKSGTFTGYLNLAPTLDNRGFVLIKWNGSPIQQ